MANQKPITVIVRSGTLGDQLVFRSVLKKYDLSGHDVILFERKHPTLFAVRKHSELFSDYKRIWQYSSALTFVLTLLYINIRVARPSIIYIGHFAKSRLRLECELLLLSLLGTMHNNAKSVYRQSLWNPLTTINIYGVIDEIVGCYFKKQDGHEQAPKMEKAVNSVVFAPFSAWQSKSLPSMFSKQAMDLLCTRFDHVHVIAGINDHIDFTEESRSNSSSVNILKGAPLKSVERLIGETQLFVGVDSAMAHLVPDHVPSIIFASDTNRNEDWRPPRRRMVYLRNYLECGGCFMRTCPLAHNKCITGFSAESLQLAINEIQSMARFDL